MPGIKEHSDHGNTNLEVQGYCGQGYSGIKTKRNLDTEDPRNRQETDRI